MGKPFGERVRDALSGDRPALSLVHGRLVITHGVGKRSSTCRICMLPIVKGPRIEIYSRHPMFHKFANGGGSAGSIHFVHYACMQRFIDADATTNSWRDSLSHCFCCGSVLDKNPETGRPRRVNFLSLTDRSAVPICDSCATQPSHFQRCWGCSRLFYPERLSLIVDGLDAYKSDGPLYLCAHCDGDETLRQVVTLRSIRRDKLLRRKVQRQYDETQAWVNQLGAVHAERSSNG